MFEFLQGVVSTELVVAYYLALYWFCFGRFNKYMKEDSE